VVHGDQQLHVDQNRMMKVGMNQDVAIGMNEVYLVHEPDDDGHAELYPKRHAEFDYQCHRELLQERPV
jgi:hypothetical protein